MSKNQPMREYPHIQTTRIWKCYLYCVKHSSYVIERHQHSCSVSTGFIVSTT